MTSPSPARSVFFLNGDGAPPRLPIRVSAQTGMAPGVEVVAGTAGSGLVALEALPADSLFLVDGGVRHARPELWGTLAPAAQLRAFWVGDADSLGDIALEDWAAGHGFASLQQLRFSRQKSLSDFAAGLDELRNMAEQGFAPDAPLALDVIGGTGARPDHEWMNVWEAMRLVEAWPVGVLVAFHPRYILSSLPFEMRLSPGQAFSILGTSDELLHVDVEGARWEGRICLERPSHGLSNQAGADGLVRIKPRDGALLVIIP